MRRAKGFTAVELMVVIAIAAILAALALPSFAHLIRKYQTKKDENALVDTIYFARSEAVKRGGGVEITKLPTADVPNCTNADDWSCGWQVVLNPIPTGPGIPADGVLKRVRTNEKSDIQAQTLSILKLNRWGNPNAGFSVNVQNKQDSMVGNCVNLASGGRINVATTCAP